MMSAKVMLEHWFGSREVHSSISDISFRGSDVCQGFLSHLHEALLDQHIEVFVDEHLERGKEISESLLKKIEESYLSVVIFSQNHAYSEWCLQELLKIAECRNTAGQIVIPVFYNIDPTHVQNLSGSYGDAMAQHRTKFDESLVESWGDVLKETASLSGLVSSNFSTESKLVEEVVKHAIEKLNCVNPSGGGLVGIDSLVEKIMSWFFGSRGVLKDPKELYLMLTREFVNMSQVKIDNLSPAEFLQLHHLIMIFLAPRRDDAHSQFLERLCRIFIRGTLISILICPQTLV